MGVDPSGLRTDIAGSSTGCAHHLLRVDLGETEVGNLDDIVFVIGEEQVLRLFGGKTAKFGCIGASGVRMVGFLSKIGEKAKIAMAENEGKADNMNQKKMEGSKNRALVF